MRTRVTRLIDAGKLPGSQTQCLYHALSQSVGSKAEPVLIFAQPTTPYISVGLYQETERNVDVDACLDARIPIYRRMLGGRTIFVDSGQLLFQAIFPKQHAASSATKVYRTVLRAALDTYRHYDVDVHYLPVHDIHVRGCRIGGSALGRLGDTIVLASRIVLDHSPEIIGDVLRNVDRECTSIRKEIGETLDIDRVREVFLAKYESHMKTTLRADTLTDENW